MQTTPIGIRLRRIRAQDPNRNTPRSQLHRQETSSTPRSHTHMESQQESIHGRPLQKGDEDSGS